MTTSFTEPKHFEEFLFSEEEAGISREVVTVKSGYAGKAGDVIELNSSKAIKCTGTLNTAGALITHPIGILARDADASASGTNADIPGVPYIARLAQVTDSLIGYPATDSPKAAVKAYLRDSLFIIQR